MAALTSDVNRPKYRTGLNTVKRPLLGGVAFTIYKGAICVSPTANLGYVRNFAGSGAATDVFAGVAPENKVVAAADANGAQSIGLYIDGVHAFPKASLAITDIGKNIYATSDQDLTTAAGAGANLWVGVLEDVDSVFAYVNITLAAGSVNVAK